MVEGRSNPATFLPDLAALVAAGRLPVDRLVSTFPLDRIEEAAEAMSSGKVAKPVLPPNT